MSQRLLGLTLVVHLLSFAILTQEGNPRKMVYQDQHFG